MSSGIWSAASGAIGQVTALDVAADNIANASTPGFRGNRAVFREVLTQAVRKRSGGFDLKYSVAATPTADTTHGPISVTGRPLDVAIRGDAFFVVKTAHGDRYTRSGSLKVNRDGLLLARAPIPCSVSTRNRFRSPRARRSPSTPTGRCARALAPRGNFCS
jgi:flagellar hook-basal body protein